MTATDLVLTVTQMLRKKGVVGKFVEFFGPGLDTMPLADRATIANMAPEYGATCGFFPVDKETLDYLTMSGREAHRIALVEDYSQGAGPVPRERRCRPRVHRHARARPGHRRALARRPEAARGPHRALRRIGRLRQGAGDRIQEAGRARRSAFPSKDADFDLGHGDVVIAAITTCTNTSNPSVLIAAGLLAKKAVEKGLTQQAVGEDVAGARLAGRHRLPRQGRPAARSRRARLQPRRLRLHHLHRQLRAAARPRSPRPSTRTTSSPRRCSPATATSRAASTPTCRRTTSPRRRSSSPTRSPARCRST